MLSYSRYTMLAWQMLPKIGEKGTAHVAGMFRKQNIGPSRTYLLTIRFKDNNGQISYIHKETLRKQRIANLLSN
jgi:hypothetical protein